MRGVKSSFSVRKTYHMIVALFLVICVGMGVVSFQYYRHLQDTVVNESGGYLQEISKQISANVSRTINDNFSVLGTIESVLENAGVATYQQLQPVVLAQQRYWNYKSVLLIDEEGNAYDAYGSVVSLAGDAYLRQAVVSRERSMSASQMVNGSECMVFAIPLDNLVIEGKKMSALAACYDLTTFDQILSMTAFDGQAYSSIHKRDGSVVVRSSSSGAPQMGYNTLSTLDSGVKMHKGDNIEKVRQDLLEGKSGIVGLTMQERELYLAYSPLETQEWCLLTFVPVSVVNAKSQLLMRLTLLLCGVVALAFAALFTLLMASSYRHKRKLEQIAYVDPITGGNTIQRFYELATERLKSSGKPQYALVYTNIEKFKILNEQFGRRVCDDMLKSICAGISANLVPQECIGRLAADNFCILIVYTSEAALYERLRLWYTVSAECQEMVGGMWLSPIIEFGVYVIGNDSMPFPHMIDRAKLSLRETGRELHGRLRCAIYDDAVRRRLFREKQLEDMMDEALKKEEFIVYLQPKYLASTETIGGAEALVRWKSEQEGMIFPDEFITLFEKNGFIIQLDLYVFEVVCRTIRAWMNAGLEPVKISVNCSRMHLKNPDFLEKYTDVCQKWGTPTKYIEIELTENVVFEDVEHLSKTIDKIHKAGFGCSMDDFGSGYSSLNLIQDIPVDTIKLDKIFFRGSSRDIERTESVVGSIIMMSKSLKMEIVAEGVEERVHVDMLKRLGCGYIQGYYFAKPMPIPDFEYLAFELTDGRFISAATVQ